MARTKSAWFIFLLLALPLIAACSTQDVSDEPVYTVITDGTLNAGDTIPEPTGDVIVTITGDIGITNVGDSIQMDREALNSVGVVEYAVLSPFDNVTITYRGILMSDLLNVWQVSDDATILQMTALNDYAVEVPIDDLRAYPVMFAMQADGEAMPISTYGPAMLVYPYDDYEFDATVYNRYWIWQIKSIDVR